jgi:hypothetical protein
MPNEYSCPPKLKLIIEHLDAVRTLDKYVNGVELKKDMQALSNHLQRDLSHNVLRPAEWEDLYPEGGYLYSSPISRPKWRVVKGDLIAIEIYIAWPVQEEEEPSVTLYVPASWKKQRAFIDKLNPPSGFEHVSQYADGELTETTCVFKYVRYTSDTGTDGLPKGFIHGFREATKALVEMTDDIDKVLGSLA